MEDDNHPHIPAQQKPQCTQLLYSLAYPCKRCKKSFTTQHGLKVHIKFLHLEVTKTPHQCHMCQKRFPYLSGLKKHVLQAHSEEKPFSCPKCSFHCKSQSNLNKHLKIHEENREKYKCSICGKDYAWKGHLKQHLKSKHASLNNEGNTESDNSQPNSETRFNVEHNNGEACGGVVEAPLENIPISVSQDVQHGLFTNEYHTTIGVGCTGSETTENEFPFAEWSCQCGNMYASQQDLHKHWDEDHKQGCSAAEAATRIVSGELSQANLLGFTSAQHEYFTATNLTSGPSNGQCAGFYTDWQTFQ